MRYLTFLFSYEIFGAQCVFYVSHLFTLTTFQVSNLYMWQQVASTVDRVRLNFTSFSDLAMNSSVNSFGLFSDPHLGGKIQKEKE